MQAEFNFAKRNHLFSKGRQHACRALIKDNLKPGRNLAAQNNGNDSFQSAEIWRLPEQTQHEKSVFNTSNLASPSARPEHTSTLQPNLTPNPYFYTSTIQTVRFVE